QGESQKNRSEGERRDSINLHHTRTAIARAHEFDFFLTEPALSEDRAIRRSQERVPEIAAEKRNAAGRLLLKFLQPVRQRVILRSEVIADAGRKQRSAGERTEQKQSWIT